MKTLHFYSTKSWHNIRSVYFTLPLWNRIYNKGNTML